MGCNQLCPPICADVLPPLGIFWRSGRGTELVISIVLMCFGVFPGVVYSCIMIGCADPKARGVKGLISDDDEAGEGSGSS